MNAELFGAFCLSATVLIVMPGPIVTLVVATSLRRGTRAGLTAVAGSSIGNALLVAAGAIGVSVVLRLMAEASDIISWLGAGYLIWLGVKAWHAGEKAADGRNEYSGSASLRPAHVDFLRGLMVAITNPKTILFYIAFFPQFIDPTLPVNPQILMMSVTMVGLAAISDSGYALLAGRLRYWFGMPERRKLQSRIVGSMLIATALGMLFARERI